MMKRRFKGSYHGSQTLNLTWICKRTKEMIMLLEARPRVFIFLRRGSREGLGSEVELLLKSRRNKGLFITNF